MATFETHDAHVLPNASANNGDPAGSTTDLHVLLQGLTLIIFSEIGDKTFLLAALLAARHPRRAVFFGAFASLVAMSILSASLGHALGAARGTRLPTKLGAAALFLVFGVKLLREGVAMREEEGKERMAKEMKEAQEEIEMDDAVEDVDALEALEATEEFGGIEAVRHGRAGRREDESDGEHGQVRRGHAQAVPLEAIERGEGGLEGGVNNTESAMRLHARRPSGSRTRRTKRGFMERTKDGLRNLGNLLLGPVFVQAFALTFLGEWGDRSQIATIALGASYNVYLVSLGTIVGHGLCTALAVVGGRYISTKISVKHITLVGGIIFVLFACIYLYEAYAIFKAPEAQVIGVI